MFKKFSFPFLLVLVVCFLFAANFSASTWLSGWDNLHPELNFPLNIKRSLFAVWQEYQGLGLLGGMGHASDLPRQILMFILSLFFPDQWLRQLYFFSTLLVGSLGVYFLLDRIILASLPENRRKLSSLAGGLFYLLNLATIQTFYTPFSAFATHFGLLPWLFLAALLYLQRPNFKIALLLFLVNLFAIPQAYVPTIFFAYLTALISVFLILFIKEKSKLHLKRVAKILIFILVINAFWLLPFLYFVFTNSNVIVGAKINQIATEDTFLRNKSLANPTDVAILRGFLFEFTDFNQITKEFDYLLSPWRKHLESPFVLGTGVFLFTIVLIGIVIAVKHKSRFGVIFLFLFFLSFTLLANNTPPFSWIDSIFYKIPLFSQAFRSPFTKISILAAFSYSIFFAFGISFLTGLLNKISTKARLVNGLALISLCGMLIFFTLPAFRGDLFYSQVKVKVPEDYLALFKFFHQQDINTRIANFPQHTFWGWNFYKWGYGGSGFLWYGIKQPILDRAFDVWSDKDENYYWEISYALYSGNQELFEKVLEKYQVNWLLVDGNIINPSSPKALYIDQLEEMLSASTKASLEKEFGKVKVYKVSLETPVRNFVFLAENLPAISPNYKWNNYDRAFLDNSHYISYPTSHFSLLTSNAYYPFRSLFSGKNQEDLEFEVEDRGEYFAFRKRLPDEFERYLLEVPKANPQDLIWVDPADLSKVQQQLQEVFFDGELIEVKVPKAGGYFSAQIDPASTPVSSDCNNILRGFLRVTLVDTTDCASFSLPNLDHKMSYLLTAESRNKAGRPLLFWLENLNSRRADIETYLPKTKDQKLKTSYFIQPPMEKDGMGYTLHFDNISIGREKAVNDLGKITVDPLPYEFLTGLVLTSTTNSLASDPRGRASHKLANQLKVDVSHPNPSLYQVTIKPFNNLNNPTLVLSQSYEKGWKAYKIKNEKLKMKNWIASLFPFLFGEEVKEHVLVNNWANGWVLGNYTLDAKPYTLVIIYLPQYLEFAGFGLIIIVLTSFVILTKRGIRVYSQAHVNLQNKTAN